MPQRGGLQERQVRDEQRHDEPDHRVVVHLDRPQFFLALDAVRFAQCAQA